MRAMAGTVEFEAAAAIFRIANPGGQTLCNMAGPDEPRKSRVM
jgi:hypothetical protein